MEAGIFFPAQVLIQDKTRHLSSAINFAKTSPFTPFNTQVVCLQKIEEYREGDSLK